MPNYTGIDGQPIDGLRIGVPLEYFEEGLDPEVRAAVEFGIDEMRASGSGSDSYLSCRTPRTRLPTYYVVATAEAVLEPCPLRWRAIRNASWPKPGA